MKRLLLTLFIACSSMFEFQVTGKEVSLDVTDQGTEYVIFYIGPPLRDYYGQFYANTETSYCLTAKKNPTTGLIQTSLGKYNKEASDSVKLLNGNQVWSVSKSAIESSKQSYTISSDDSYLYYDGSARKDYDLTDAGYSWFLNDERYLIGKNLINLNTSSFLAPFEEMEGMQLIASSDSTNWLFIKNEKQYIESYLASTYTADQRIKQQVLNGTYYIFYAGTNYCLTDTRQMSWYKSTYIPQGEETPKTDSIYIPGDGVQARYKILLNEFKAASNQQWRVNYYSDFVDQDQKHTFWNRTSGKRDAYGFYPLVTEHMHWRRDSDSASHTFGARLITSVPYDLQWIDREGTPQIVKDYFSILGDKGCIVNDDNDQSFFAKHIVKDLNDIYAIYRPMNVTNLPIEAIAMKQKFAGASIYVTPDEEGGNPIEMKYNCWNFVDINNPVVATANAAKSLIDRDTVFAYPTAPVPGEYFIQYRGAKEVLTYMPGDEATNDPASVAVKTFAADNANQIWRVDTLSNGRITLSNGYKQLYMAKEAGKQAQVYSLGEATIAGIDSSYSHLESLYLGTTNMGRYGAWMICGDTTTRKYFDLASQSLGGKLQSVNEPTDFPFVLVPKGKALNEGEPLPDTTLIPEGFYYIQYAYAADSFNVSKQYVIAPTQEITSTNSTLKLEPYDPFKPMQQWYIAPIGYSVDQLASGAATHMDSYGIFAAASVKDSLAAGLSVLDIINDPNYLTAGYRVLDSNTVLSNETLKDNYARFSYKMYIKNGKIALRTASESGYHSFLSDGMNDNYYEFEVTDQTKKINKDLKTDRSFCYYLIPAVSDQNPAFKKIYDYAPWTNLPCVVGGCGDVEKDNAPIESSVFVNDNIITIADAGGATIEVLYIDGTSIASIASAGATEKISVRNQGIYIVKINNTAVKVVVK
ncbi:MAG: hypothetical protein PHI48_04680 [Bacteroidales bacterium]|nr:hypothetical protein [Bacteroidales bacterium]